MRSHVLFLLFLAGCPTNVPKDDTGGTDDTGNPDQDYDPGCITVDGGGGYAHLADALTVANEGAVIWLCDGTYEEAVTIDKGVTIQGESQEGVIIAGPGSDVPLTLIAAGITVTTLSVESPRTGIVLDSASDATITDVTVASAGSWGLSSNSSTATISGLTIVEPTAGGIEVSGGSLSIASSSIESPNSYGFDISDADVQFDDSTISAVYMLSEDVSDGYFVNMDGGSLSMNNSTLNVAGGIGIYASGAEIELTSTTITDAYYLGLFAFESTYVMDGVQIVGSVLNGLYAEGTTFTMTNSSITTGKKGSCSYLYDEWGTDGNPWCGAMLVAADTITLEEVDVSGYENYGMLLQPYEEDMAATTIVGGSVTDTGRWGAYLYNTEGTVTGLEISANREPETEDPCASYIDRGVGLLLLYPELTLDGLTISGNEGWGISSLYGDATVTNSTFDGNGCTGLVNYSSLATLTGNTFTNGSDYGGIYDYAGVLEITGNTFTTNHAGSLYSYEHKGVTYEYGYTSGQGQDIIGSSTGSAVISGNTFSDGDSSLTFYTPTELEITSNTWTDYEGSILYVYQGSEDSPPYFADNTVDDVVGPVAQSSYGPLEVVNNTVGTTRISDDITYESYADGVLQYSWSYTNSATVFYGSGYYWDDGSTVTDYPGSITISDTTVDTAYSSFAYSSDASIAIEDCTVGSVGGYAVGGYWSGHTPDVYVSGLTVGATTSTAFYLEGREMSGAGTVELSDVDVESSAGDGVYVSAMGEVSLSDVSFGPVSGDGVELLSISYWYYYDSTSGSYIYDDVDGATELTLEGVDFESVGGYGLTVKGGSTSLTDVTVGATGSGGFLGAGMDSLTMDTVSFTSPVGDGVSSGDGYTYYSYASSSTVPVISSPVVSLTDVTVATASGSAFAFSGGAVTLSGVSGTGSTDNGLDLDGVTATVTGNTLSSNGGYGMTCTEDVVLASCSGNDLTNNTLGTHSGCSDSCGE